MSVTRGSHAEVSDWLEGKREVMLIDYRHGCTDRMDDGGFINICEGEGVSLNYNNI